MDFSVLKGIKRKCSSSIRVKSSKHKPSQVNIQDLSDCTLLNILKYLDATSLYHLGETCTRFKQLVLDDCLWVNVDARLPPHSLSKHQYCWQNIRKKTKRFLTAANARSSVILSLPDLIFSKNLDNLTVLALEHQHIKYCKLREFPNSLEELSLRHSYVPNHKEFFRFANEAMHKLKTLLLDHCQWFESGSLMSISKYPQLEILSLYMCKKLADDDISSISLVGKFGYKKLKVIDLRFTGLGDLFIKAFYKSTNLQVLYFQCYPTTYRLERTQRKLDLVNGERMRLDGYLSNDEDNNDLSRRSFRKRFKAGDLIPLDAQTITDGTMTVFNCLKPTTGSLSRPQSYLYVYPYEECTCGFFDKKLGRYGPVRAAEHTNEDHTEMLEDDDSNSHSDTSDDDDDDDVWSIKALQLKLEYERKKQRKNTGLQRSPGVFFLQPHTEEPYRKLLYNGCTLPAWCQTLSNPQNCLQPWLYLREPRNDYEISMLEHTDKHFRARCSTVFPGLFDAELHEDRNIIILSRVEASNTMELTVATKDGDVTNQILDKQSIINLVETMAQLIETIDSNKVEFIKRVLDAFSICLGATQIGECIENANFVCDLWDIFENLAKHIKNSTNRVLKYHQYCFNELMLLLKCNNDIAFRQNLILCFFKHLFNNVLCDTCAEDLHVEEKCNNSKDEGNWNQPGASGLQSRKRKHDTQADNKKKIYFDSGPEKKSRKSKTEVVEIVTPNHVFKRVLYNNFLYKHSGFVYQMNNDDQPVLRVQLHRPLYDVAVNELVRDNARNIDTNIKELSLRGYHISNGTLDLLKEMELDLLDVTCTNVTLAGIQRFMMSNPQCRVIHEYACVCRPKLHF